jgi:hypothetical protein
MMQRGRTGNYDEEWDDQAPAYGDLGYSGGYGVAPYDYGADVERGLMEPDAPPVPSLVGVSATITNYGAPLLNYARTMQRFYQSRRRVLSMGRHRCAICSERISGWAWLGPDETSHAHDGCYDRLAWAWANVVGSQQ